MEPGRALGVLSAFALGSDGLACILLLSAGFEAAPVAALGGATAAAYLYVIYKRYRVEVVPASDLLLFDDTDDLRILSRIYGLDPSGSEAQVRGRLRAFADRNEGSVFVWIPPRVISWMTSNGRQPLTPSQLADELLSDRPLATRPDRRPLIPGTRNRSKGARLKTCPVCDEKAPLVGTTCKHCGADLGFYSALTQSRVGRRLVNERASAVRRKLRYDVPSIRDRP